MKRSQNQSDWREQRRTTRDALLTELHKCNFVSVQCIYSLGKWLENKQVAWWGDWKWRANCLSDSQRSVTEKRSQNEWHTKVKICDMQDKWRVTRKTTAGGGFWRLGREKGRCSFGVSVSSVETFRTKSLVGSRCFFHCILVFAIFVPPTRTLCVVRKDELWREF